MYGHINPCQWAARNKSRHRIDLANNVALVSTPIYIVEAKEIRIPLKQAVQWRDTAQGEGGRRSCEIERHLLIINSGIIEPRILNNLGRAPDKHRPLVTCWIYSGTYHQKVR